MNTLDLCVGAGGLSLGLEQAGHRVIAGVDVWEDALDTYKYNHASVGIHADIHTTEPSELSISKNQVDLVAGGPPCQGFSIAGDRDSKDERNQLIARFLDYVSYFEPESVVMENVEGILSMELESYNGLVTEYIHDRLAEMGYNSDHKTLTATDYGVPQKRNRVFFIAHKNKNVTFPDPTVDDVVTIGETFSTICDNDPNMETPNQQQKTIDRIKNTTQGDPLYESYSQRIRLDSSKPSPTLVSGGSRPQWQLAHPTENRGLTVRERAAIQSFPNDYVFKNGIVSCRKQTGNAVPPKMARAVGEELIR